MITCFYNLLNINFNEKNVIIKIIIIHFIQYKEKDLDIIFNEKYKNMLISYFIKIN